MVINFFGRRGSGKTTTIRGNLHDCRPPVLIIDLLGNFNSPDYIQCTEVSEAIDEIEAWYSDEKKKWRPGSPVINLQTADPATAADYFSAAIWELHGGTLVLDEIDSFNYKEGSCFDQYIRYGRNHDGDLITGCRRPAEVSRNITAAANKIFCFQTGEPRDCEYFEKTVFGERAWELMKIPKFTGLYMDHDIQRTGQYRIDEAGNIYYTSSETT